MTIKNFIITSHTEGKNAFVKKTLLHGLVQSIKKYWPESYVIIASQSEVEYDTQLLADYVVVNRSFQDIPHGVGEVESLNAALTVLESQGKTECYKLCYDFIINDSNFHVFDEWKSHNKDFVACWWNSIGLGVGTWIWYGTTDFQRKILNFPVLDMFLEQKVLQIIENNQLFDQCYIYETPNAMLANTWEFCGDQAISGGSGLKRDYGSILAVVQSKNRLASVLPLVYHSVVTQKLKPAHLLLVDSGAEFVDLRHDPVYQKLFQLCEHAGISWSVIFSTNVDQVLPPGFMWRWDLDENTIPAYNELETLYRATILDHTISSVAVPNGSKLTKLSV